MHARESLSFLFSLEKNFNDKLAVGKQRKRCRVVSLNTNSCLTDGSPCVSCTESFRPWPATSLATVPNDLIPMRHILESRSTLFSLPGFENISPRILGIYATAPLPPLPLIPHTQRYSPKYYSIPPPSLPLAPTFPLFNIVIVFQKKKNIYSILTVNSNKYFTNLFR